MKKIATIEVSPEDVINSERPRDFFALVIDKFKEAGHVVLPNDEIEHIDGAKTGMQTLVLWRAVEQ